MSRVHFQSQFNDPTTDQDGQNCTAAAFTMLLELASGKRMYPGEFRRLQSDTEGGISIPDGVRAWHKATDATIEYAAPLDGTSPPFRRGNGIIADQAWARLSEGRGFVWQGLYRVLAEAGYGLQPGFTAGHAVYVDAVRTSTIMRRREALILDPLGRGTYDGQWIPWNTLVQYGTALGLGSLIYAAWAEQGLPDTGTEEQVTYDVLPNATSGVISVKGTGHYFLRLSDNTLHGPISPTNPDWQNRPAYGPLKMKGGKLDGSTVYQIGTDAAFLLTQDVTFTPKAGDVSHTITVLKDGQKQAEFKA